jgi:hypothetical protein
LLYKHKSPQREIGKGNTTLFLEDEFKKYYKCNGIAHNTKYALSRLE